MGWRGGGVAGRRGGGAAGRRRRLRPPGGGAPRFRRGAPPPGRRRTVYRTAAPTAGRSSQHQPPHSEHAGDRSEAGTPGHSRQAAGGERISQKLEKASLRCEEGARRSIDTWSTQVCGRPLTEPRWRPPRGNHACVVLPLASKRTPLDPPSPPGAPPPPRPRP